MTLLLLLRLLRLKKTLSGHEKDSIVPAMAAEH